MLYNVNMKEEIFDCLIIGGGPAGVTAAIYLKRAGKTVALFEGGMFGGQVATTSLVENYPAVGEIEGFMLATKFLEDLKRNDVKIIYENAVNFNFNSAPLEVETKSGKFKGRTIILAMGVRARQIDPELENKFKGKGISYCATCDGGFYKNKDVAVIGGGKSAFSEAVYLAGICKTVTLVHRSDKFRVSQQEVNFAKSKRIKIKPFYVLTNVFGEDKLSGIEVTNTNTGKSEKLNIDGLFVSVGRVPNTELLAGKILLDEFGFIKSEDCTTSVKNVFVAGDIRTKSLRQIVTATSDGAISATLAIMALNQLN